MLPKLAIVGRPNVGKSALFNRICQKRVSIVDEAEGITRDRIYAEASLFGRPFLLIDTGGIDFAGKIPFAEEVKRQAEFAIQEADAILFVVDGKVGATTEDELLAKVVRKTNKPVFILVNKMDREEEVPAIFAGLGIGQMVGVSAMHGHQVAEMLELALNQVEQLELLPTEIGVEPPIRVAILGRTNVGKSTLLNHILGDERSIASPIPGTTRDAIDVTIEKEGKHYLLIDTAGIRRKKSEKEVVDKFAAIRTQEALERADVVLLVCDAFEGFTTQEMRIASEIEQLGKSCIL